jgi:hypothetical protein
VTADGVAWCEHCGQSREEPVHERCVRADLDPPRWCTRCRRRMVVQITPLGWTARCIEHGTIAG